MTLATASALVALTGCAPGQPLGPPCPMVDFDIVITVNLITDEDVEAVGLCDEIACSTDDDIPEDSRASDVHLREYASEAPNTWSFSTIPWVPHEFGVVAIVDGEEVDLGTQKPEITYHEIDGPHCGSIPEHAPVTIEL